jgi:adenylate cyclase
LAKIELRPIRVRSRRLALTRASAERWQANLARYFSPRVVERLARLDQPFGGDRRQDVVVLFAPAHAETVKRIMDSHS